MKLLFATTNQGKLEELRALVRNLPIKVISLKEVEAIEVVEDGETFEQNALKKASIYCDRTKLATVADDSGLCVDALHGAPGVYSARYCGVEKSAPPFDSLAISAANNLKLLRELESEPIDKRGAEFHCVLAFCVAGKPAVTVDGTCRGRIALSPRGTEGFGYDPLFELPHLNKTFAQLTPDEKNRLSHRALAFEKLRPYLERWSQVETAQAKLIN